MDHNLDDSLNLESAMGVDFVHSEDSVVNQEDICLQTGGSEQNIPMEFQPIEEQPMLMDTGSEEIIDFMGDQFALQEYEVPDDQVSNLTTTVEANNQLTISSQAEGLGGLQLEPQTIKVTLGNTMQEPKMTQAKVISVKAAAPNLRPIAPKKETIVLTKSVAPRQIAIAPKPYKLAETSFKNVAAGPPKQFAIAPKPVAMVANKSVSLVKKLPDGSKGTVFAQIGKQLVMVPTSGAQKIKLVTAGPGVPPVRLLGTADAEQAQLIAQSLSGSQNNQRLTKVIVQGGGESGAVLTRLGAPPGRLLAVQQRNVPISIGHNKVLVTSPTKSGIKFTKKQQLIAIKSPNTKILPATTAQGSPTTKKVVITANPPQNMILKTTAPPKVGHITKVGQRTQVHQINVPGKGIQYIRLVTNPTPKPAPKPPLTPSAGKTYVLSDSKGNFIQMSSDKMTQPPPLLVTNVSSSNKSSLSFNPQQKLVRIAPIPAKPQQMPMHQQPRGGQSLLAPLSPGPAPDAQAALIDEMSKLLEADPVSEQVIEEPEGKPDINNIAQMEETVEEEEAPEEPQDSKAMLRALIADAVGSDADSRGEPDDARDQTRQSSMGEDSNSMERAESRQEHPLIVIPSYMKQDMIVPDDHADYEDSRRMINIEVEPYNTYQSPNASQAMSDQELIPGELGLRPRKACNCTKSQCLKLYCDCFANGEFCNSCNCANCHNNLENEELRQKAIRGCLDRNPNAFRPKIGKSKTGGPEHIIRRHNKGCNCKRSGCLKNYCECYEAKIACSHICKCVGCRNVEETLQRSRRARARPAHPAHPAHLARSTHTHNNKQPCSFMTTEVIEAVCQCLIAAAVEADGEGGAGAGAGGEGGGGAPRDPLRDVIDEFARCLQDIISASHHAAPLPMSDIEA